jgi:tail lysozyme
MGDDDLVPDGILPDIDQDDFTRQCLAAARANTVSPHYLIVVANQVSKIKNIPSPVAGSDAFGPFQLTSDTWTSVALPMQFSPEERFDPGSQCFVAAKITADQGSGLKPALPGGNAPTGAELFFTWTFGLTVATIVLGSGRDRSQSIQAALTDAFHNDAAKVTAAINANADLLKQGGQPRTIQQVLDAIVALLDPGLQLAITLIDKAEPGLFPAPTSTSGSLGTSGAASGDPLKVFAAKAPVVMRKLISDFGFTDFQAGGILGNLGQESGGFTQLQEIHPVGGGKGGFGWFQWTGPRRTAFENFCTQSRLDPTSDDANYGFLKVELGTSPQFKNSVTALKATTTLAAATQSFEETYEIAGVVALDKRIVWAQRAMAAFQSTGTS